jgi:chromate transporter
MKPETITTTFKEALNFWTKLGFISFGGPAGQIAIMHHEVVERRKWIGEDQFLRALNFCMLLPGPEAQQLATYIGWRLHGIRGGIVAGAMFVIPSIFVMLLLSYLAVAHIDIPATPWIHQKKRGSPTEGDPISLAAYLNHQLEYA